jgi:hypothetical protein
MGDYDPDLIWLMLPVLVCVLAVAHAINRWTEK